MRSTGDLRVVLADRPGVGHEALARLIGETPGLSLVGDVHDGVRLEAAIDETDPDVLVVDDRVLGDAPGAGRRARLIVVGVDDDPGFVARAHRLGAETWLPKERADALLPLALLSPAGSRQPAPRSASAG